MYIVYIVDGQDLGVADGGKGGDNTKEEDNIHGSGGGGGNCLVFITLRPKPLSHVTPVL
jgi:hypothetical protein